MKTPLPQSPFIVDRVPFEPDMDHIAIEMGLDPRPLFLADPSESFLEAIDFNAIADVLTKY